MNTKKQGDAGVGSAVAYFTQCGYTVSIPLTDSQDYDLIVDIDGKLNRVQVKTSRCSEKSGIYKVNLRVLGGNRSGTGKVKHFDSGLVEYVYILVANGDRYFIPTSAIESKSCIHVGQKYLEYKV